jgi:hypothetical protein
LVNLIGGQKVGQRDCIRGIFFCFYQNTRSYRTVKYSVIGLSLKQAHSNQGAVVVQAQANKFGDPLRPISAASKVGMGKNIGQKCELGLSKW